MTQNEQSQQSSEQLKLTNRSSYKYSDKQTSLCHEIIKDSKGIWSDICYNALKIFTGTDSPISDFQQQSIYVADMILGCATQDYLDLKPNYWSLCIGESGSGKTVANIIVKESLRRIPNNTCWNIKMPASEGGLYTALNALPRPCAFIEYDEGLNKLVKLWNNNKPETSGIVSNLLETLMSIYEAGGDLSEVTNKDPSKSSKGIIRPVVSLSITGQALSYARACSVSEFIDKGFYHRCLIYDFIGRESCASFNEYLDEADTSRSLRLDDDKLLRLKSKIKVALKTDTQPVEFYIKQGRAPSSSYDFTKDYNELLTYLNELGEEAHARAIIEQYNNRMRDKIKTLARLHAWGRGADTWESDDVTWAMKRAGLHYQNILNRLKNSPIESRNDYLLIKYIYDKVIFCRKIEHVYITKLVSKKNGIKHFHSPQIKQAIKYLCEEGLIIEHRFPKTRTYYTPASSNRDVSLT